LFLDIINYNFWRAEKANRFKNQTASKTFPKNSIFPKSVKLNELTAIWKLRSSFRLEAKNSKIKINKDLIDDESLYKLTDLLDQIKLKPQQK
jgi:hypothetical protein